MESYIVRIYRRGNNSLQTLVGIVEEVGASEKKAFSNFDELWYILNIDTKEPAKPRKREKAEKPIRIG